MEPMSDSTLRRLTKNAMYKVVRKREADWNELKDSLEKGIENLEHNLSLMYSDGLKQKIDSFKDLLSKMQEIESRKQ